MKKHYLLLSFTSLFCCFHCFAQQFQQAYGGTSLDIALSVRPTSDGGYICTGYTQSYGTGTQDIYLVKTKASGDTLWSRIYGSQTFNDAASSVEQTFDGGY